VLLRDLVTSNAVAVLTAHKGRILSAAFSPDGTHLTTTGDDGTMRLWDTSGAVEEGHQKPAEATTPDADQPVVTRLPLRTGG